jgi:glycosyltransferase involved in cell wall biosynthesis
LATNPELQVVMVGGDGKGYGPVADHPSGHLGAAFDQLRGQLDLRRLHRPGALPHAQLRRLLQLSSAHVYLTYPYALSWSVLEAMACGAPTVGNHSGPLDDVICDGHNGRLVDFNQPHQLSAALAELLADPEQQRRLGREARRTVEEHYRLDQAVERYEALFNRLVSHRSS